jgi:hypothetical protein
VQADEAPDWPLPAAKVFTPKYKLPAISDYREPAPPEFWEIFPSRAPAVGRSMVSEQKLREVYEEAGLVASQALEEVCNDIKHGADIGCKEEFRSGNAPSAFDFGAQVTEICLVFGAVSSAGLYDRLAKVVLVVVIALRSSTRLTARWPGGSACCWPTRQTRTRHSRHAQRGSC